LNRSALARASSSSKRAFDLLGRVAVAAEPRSSAAAVHAEYASKFSVVCQVPQAQFSGDFEAD